jgi:hypothetical protein
MFHPLVCGQRPFKASQAWSRLLKPGQGYSSLVKATQGNINNHFLFFGICRLGVLGVDVTKIKPKSNRNQTESNRIKPNQTGSNRIKPENVARSTHPFIHKSTNPCARFGRLRKAMERSPVGAYEH